MMPETIIAQNANLVPPVVTWGTSSVRVDWQENVIHTQCPCCAGKMMLHVPFRTHASTAPIHEQKRSNALCASWLKVGRQIDDVLGWAVSHGKKILCLCLISLLLGALFVARDAILRSRLFVENRFQQDREIMQPREVYGVGRDDQTGIGWDAQGKAYALLGWKHVIANHNEFPDQLFFFTLQGHVVSKKLIPLEPIYVECTGRSHLRLAKLETPFAKNEVNPLPLWVGSIEQMPAEECIIFASHGIVGKQRKGVGCFVNQANERWPMMMTEMHPRRRGDLAVKHGDSGCPVLVHVDGRWYLHSLCYGYDSRWKGYDGILATKNLHQPLAPYLKELRQAVMESGEKKQNLTIPSEWLTQTNEIQSNHVLDYRHEP